MKLLHIDSSITGEASASRQVSAAIVAALKREHRGLDVVRRDLEADPLPHLDGRLIATIRPDVASADRVTPAEAEAAAAALQEFLDADVVVIGAPMYNFGVSTQLKAWLDRVLIAGKTFRYTATGPEGLAGGKRVIVASSRGNFYTPGAPFEANDFQERYLRAVFAFIGVTDLEIVRAEGLAISPDHREAALAAALEEARNMSAVAGALAA